MKYQIIQLEQQDVVGQSFELPTTEIQTTDYSQFYGQVCKGMNPATSFGIYQVSDQVTTFTVAIETEVANDYPNVTIAGGEYYQFELDMMENMKDNQYVKCFDTLKNNGLDFDISYSIEIMDRSFDPSKGQFNFKYLIKKN